MCFFFFLLVVKHHVSQEDKKNKCARVCFNMDTEHFASWDLCVCPAVISCAALTCIWFKRNAAGSQAVCSWPGWVRLPWVCVLPAAARKPCAVTPQLCIYGSHLPQTALSWIAGVSLQADFDCKTCLAWGQFSSGCLVSFCRTVVAGGAAAWRAAPARALGD